MLGGYMGKVLWVDLTKGEIKEEPLNEQDARDFLGGNGLGAKILFEKMQPGVDPLGPYNILGFTTGPLTGTPSIEGNRFEVVCKSPLTDGGRTLGKANCGGTFGPALKFSGFDMVFFTGKSEKPVYLFIDNGKAQLLDAQDIWGKGGVTWVEDTLKARHGKCEVAQIGPVGEMGSLISAIINDYGRAAGRSGVGAVMGSKNLKAVVAKGDQKVPLADEAKCNELRKEYMKKNGGAYELFANFGTLGVTCGSAMSGDSPIRNWGGSGARDLPDGYEAWKDTYVIQWQDKKYGCWHCTMACGGHVSTKPGDAPYEGLKGHKPEYETACMAGSNILMKSMPAMIKINNMLNDAGYDTISAGATLAFAFECFENGIITKQDLGGIELKWGEPEGEIALLDLMIKNEGFGKVLFNGSRKASQLIGKGSAQYSMDVAGQELPAHDPRLECGLATTYIMDPTPGRHTQGGENWPPMGIDFPTWDRLNPSGEVHKKLSALMQVIDSTGTCEFPVLCYDFNWIPEFLTAVRGEKFTLDDVFKTGNRLQNMRHAFNIREGINPIERDFPPRMVGVPALTHGNNKGVTVNYAKQIKDYCEAMGWDPVTAKPSKAALEEAGLGWVAKELGAE